MLTVIPPKISLYGHYSLITQVTLSFNKIFNQFKFLVTYCTWYLHYIQVLYTIYMPKNIVFIVHTDLHMMSTVWSNFLVIFLERQYTKLSPCLMLWCLVINVTWNHYMGCELLKNIKSKIQGVVVIDWMQYLQMLAEI